MTDQAAEEELYRAIGRSLAASSHGWYRDFDDDHHDAYLMVLRSIRRGAVRRPESLLGFVRTVARRRFATRMIVRTRDRLRSANVANPLLSSEELDVTVYHNELWLLIDRGLSELDSVDQELLRLFYIKGLSREEVMREMGLDAVQYRLKKSRALKRLLNAVRRFSPSTALQVEAGAVSA